MSAGIVAFGAVSAMGEGQAAASAGTPGERARVFIQRDDELARAGLARPHAARVALDPEAGAEDRATAILLRAVRACIQELDQALPGWRDLRVGLALGTSSGGMRTAETLFESQLRTGARVPSRELAAGALYYAPMLEAARAIGKDLEPATLVLGACAASTLAIGLGMRWLSSDACDLVLVGGFDAVATFVAAGFEVLRATSAEIPPRPFRTARDGMALGEGAAILALMPSRLAPRARVHVTGFGATSDAVHLTAPDRTGAGLASAAKRALAEADVARPDSVSPHGSATPFSDAAEVRALSTAIGAGAEHIVVHPFKAQIGHTLGASGALETLACVDALTRGVFPAAAGDGEVDPDARANLLDVACTGPNPPRTALKLSAAFGGANAALMLSLTSAPPSLAGGRAVRRPVFVRRAVQVTERPLAEDLATRIGWPIERVQRADAVAQWVLAAVAQLVLRDGACTSGGSAVGIIVGTTFATMETNASFFARMHERGARMAEPRKFPYTSPNAAAGDAAAAFGLRGPCFAVGSGGHAALEALVAATHLVGAGDAEAMVVVAVDEIGPTVSRVAEALEVEVSSGAVALVVSADNAGAVAEVISARCGIGPSAQHYAPGHGHGHQTLLPLALAEPPALLAAMSPDPQFPVFRSRAADGHRGHQGVTAWARVELRVCRPVARGIDAVAAEP